MHFSTLALFISFTACIDCIEGTQYAVLIDAGSSKSQVYVFSWTEVSTTLPTFQQRKGLKLKPGISSFSKNIPGLRSYIGSLLSNASAQLPKQHLIHTNVYLLSTAGMRLLREDSANNVMAEINVLLSDTQFNPFKYSSQENARILSGEEEGVFSWMAVNYDNNKFQNRDTDDSIGVIEMGGASTQITFSTHASILANKFPVTIAGTTYPLYAYSHLQYGQAAMEELLKKQLIFLHPDAPSIHHPCLVRGDEQTYMEKRLVGTGDSISCNNLIKVFISKLEEPWRCSPKPCSIGSAYQPSIPALMDFYLVGAFKFTFERVAVVNETHRVLSFESLKQTTDSFCRMTKAEVMQRYPIDIEEFISLPCYVGNYAQLLLHDAYRFPWNTTRLINDGQSDWTLGALIYEYEKEKSLNCRSSASFLSGPRLWAKAIMALIVVALNLML